MSSEAVIETEGLTKRAGSVSPVWSCVYFAFQSM